MICIFRRNRVKASKHDSILERTKDHHMAGVGGWWYVSSFGVSRATAKWKSEPGHPTREKFTSSSNLRKTEPNRTMNWLRWSNQSLALSKNRRELRGGQQEWQASGPQGNKTRQKSPMSLGQLCAPHGHIRAEQESVGLAEDMGMVKNRGHAK